MFSVGSDVGIDLGTANSLVFVAGKGVVLDEPSVFALDQGTGRVLAVGSEARRMLGRTPGNIIAIRPIRAGATAVYTITEAMLKYFLSRVYGRRMLIRPRVMVSVPSGVTSVEKRAVLEATAEAGSRKTYLIEEPLAAALGAGLDIVKPSGCFVVNIGGGTTDVAVLSLGGIVLSESSRVAGDKFDEAIIRYVKREYNLLIGERTAEEIKLTVGTACPGEDNRVIEVRGRDLLTGLPKTVSISSNETCEAMSEPLSAVIYLIKSVLERTPPELAADIYQKGIVLTGGGALLRCLDKLLHEHTGIPVIIAEDPLRCVVLGTGKALEYLGVLKDSLFSSGKP